MKSTVLFLLPTAISLRAATVVEVSGGSGGPGNRVFATSWTQANTFDSVSITAGLYGVVPDLHTPPVIATAWLTTAIGSGATIADHVATTSITSSTMVLDPAVPLFSGLTLGPQTYYLVLLISSGSNAAGITENDSPTPVTGVGVTIGSSYQGPFLDFPSFGPSADLTPLSAAQFVSEPVGNRNNKS